MLVLSLFPGIGLLDRAFEEHGFCIVRGPDVLWGGDVKIFHPPAARFDGVIGGPPCQAFSRLVRMVKQNGYTPAENLIPEFERCVSEAQPQWFMMENVIDAPAPEVAGYSITSFVFSNRWVGAEQDRTRRISFGVFGSEPVDLRKFIEVSLFELPEKSTTVCASNRNVRPVKIGGNGKASKHPREQRPFVEALRLQGLPSNFLEHAPFTAEGKQRVVGNGVPLPLGRALAGAVRDYLAVHLTTACSRPAQLRKLSKNFTRFGVCRWQVG